VSSKSQMSRSPYKGHFNFKFYDKSFNTMKNDSEWRWSILVTKQLFKWNYQNVIKYIFFDYLTYYSTNWSISSLKLVQTNQVQTKSNLLPGISNLIIVAIFLVKSFFRSINYKITFNLIIIFMKINCTSITSINKILIQKHSRTGLFFWNNEQILTLYRFTVPTSVYTCNM